jgi:hypothetical protein
MKIEARASDQHVAQVLDAFEEMRGGALRSNLETSKCILWIERRSSSFRSGPTL